MVGIVSEANMATATEEKKESKTNGVVDNRCEVKNKVNDN
jgi:hypothetical protein